MQSNKKKLTKILLISSLCLIIILVVSLSIIPPLILSEMIDGPITFSTVYDPNDFDISSDEIILSTKDDLDVVAYEVKVAPEFEQPKGVIVFLSGIHNPSVTAFFGHTAYLRDEGFASLLVEMRAHDRSEGDLIGMGYTEVYDIDAALQYLKNKPEYSAHPIILYGLSMGGATVINATGLYDDVDAFISLSAYSSVADMFTDQMSEMGFPGFYVAMQKPFVRLYLGFKYGFDTWHHTPATQIQNLGSRPALLMHSTQDSQISADSFQRLLDLAPDHVESWLREGDYHFITDGESFLQPADDPAYIERVRDFLLTHFD